MRNLLKYFIFLLPFLAAKPAFTQSDSSVDSVILFLQNRPDTNIAKSIYHVQLRRITDGKFDDILRNGRQVLSWTMQLENKLWYAQNIRLLGIALERTGKIDSALKTYGVALNIAKELKKQKLEAQCYHNLGFANYLQSSFDNAIVNYLNAIKIREELKDSVPLGWSLNNIGLIYWRQHSYKDALKHFIHARSIFKAKKFLEGLAISTSNIGLIYDEMNKKNIAYQYYYESYEINEQIGNKAGIALSLNNLGEILRWRNELDSCMANLNRALAINLEINNLEGLELNYRNLADIYRTKKNYKKAIDFIHKAIEVSKEGKLAQGLISSYATLSLIHAEMGNYKDAYESHLMYSRLNDSLNFGDKLATLEAAFGREKMEKEVSRLKSEKEITDLQIKHKEWIIYSTIIGLITFAFVFFFILKINIQRKNANRSLEQKNSEITRQKEIIEQKSKDITDSILYAKRIQSAVLPEQRDFRTSFSSSFVLFEPRDIVSGDFYWLHQVNNAVILILADCTGHGVPGAFMSIIGHDLLNQIIKEEGQTDPSRILHELDYKLFQMLNKNNYATYDGMDIAVCSFDLVQKKLSFAGAGRPLVKVEDSSLELIQGNKFSIGSSAIQQNKVFTNTEIRLNQKQSFYLMSDGFSDQFGGEKGKKFKTKKLLETIKNLKDIPFDKQKEFLLSTFRSWKGDLEQVDDVCVIGIRI